LELPLKYNIILVYRAAVALATQVDSTEDVQYIITSINQSINDGIKLVLLSIISVSVTLTCNVSTNHKQPFKPVKMIRKLKTAKIKNINYKGWY